MTSTFRAQTSLAVLGWALVLLAWNSALAAERDATIESTATPRSIRLHAGAQAGFPHLVGITALATILFDDKPRFDADLLWEPSGFLQSYSVGLAWRPADKVFYVGPRFRLLQFHPPWSRGYRPDFHNFFGLGLEAGARIGLGASKRSVITVGLQITGVPAQAANLNWLFGLNIGFVYGFKDWVI